MIDDPKQTSNGRTEGSPLFTAVDIGRYRLPNRIVMAPMTRDRTPGQIPNPLNARYYAQRAAGGPGLIVTEGTAPDRLGLGYIDIPGLYTEEQAIGWREVALAVHEAAGTHETGAGRIFAQLMYVGRVSHPDFLNGDIPFAPSAVQPSGTVFTAEGPKPFVQPRAMTEPDIEAALSSFGHASRLAVEVAGLDGVEVHGANGYLPSQFLAPNANLREDGWGGDIKRRSRFLIEAVDRAVAAVGADRVGVRLSPGGTFNDIDDPDWPDTYAYLLPELDRRGLAYAHILLPPPPPEVDAAVVGTQAPVSVPDHVRRHYRGKVILSGGYDRPRADADIRSGRTDLVSFGGPFLANPDLPQRLASGAPLNTPDPTTFYGGGEQGYTDYQAHVATAAA